MKFIQIHLILLVLVSGVDFQTPAHAEYAIPYSVFGNGGAVLQGSTYRLASTVGQPAIGEIKGVHNNIYSGFWYIAGLSTTEDSVCVWPGDTDNNGVVNQADVLPIGLYWGLTGPARSGASSKWECQLIHPWFPQKATYADASGNGKVDQADVLPIGVNWGHTHEPSSPLADVFLPPAGGVGQPAAIAPVVLPRPLRKQFTVGVRVDAVKDLFGIAFVLKYPRPETIKPVSVEAGDFLGGDVIFHPHVDATQGTIRVGISQKRPQRGQSGSGIVAKITFEGAVAIPAVRLTIDEITAIDADGRPILFGGGPNAAPGPGEWVLDLPPDTTEAFQNFPNPFNPETWIPFQLKASAAVTLIIYDGSGKVIREFNLGHKPAGFYTSKASAAYWDGRNDRGESVSSGIYFYHLRTGDFQATKKMIILK